MTDIDHRKTRNLMYLNTAIAMLRAIHCYSYAEEAHIDLARIDDELSNLRDTLEDLGVAND